MRCRVALVALLATFWAPALRAQVERADVTRREPVLDGRAFGDAGSYEKLSGELHFAIDPSNPANRAIVDLELAPRDADGRVRCRADFFVLQPKDPEKRAGLGLLEVSNRGGKGILARFCAAQGSADPSSEAQFGDGLLLRAGLTLIWVGWQFDVPARRELLRLHVPTARHDDGPIEGLVRADWLVEENVASLHLGHRDHRAYPASSPDDPRNVLTVRSGREASRTTLPRETWHFADDRQHVTLDGGFERGLIYELVYVAESPAIVGLGLAAIRDTIAFAKHDESCPFRITHGIAVGISQSGRFLRQFLWQDFNTDTEGRIAFDGMFALVAGAGRGSFNHRFAQPSRDAHHLHAFFFPTDLFPFTSRAQDDPTTGRRDGLVEGHTRHVPKFFQLNGGYEYHGRAAALIHTSVDGERDVEPLPTERIYALASAQHFDVPLPRRPRGDEIELLRGNPVDSAAVQRALLIALIDWVRDDKEPPPSRFPRLDDATLVPLSGVSFPSIPGVSPPRVAHVAYRADYGPQWQNGIATIEPPKLGPAFPCLVPQLDALGNEIGGIRTVELTVPLATFTPWHPHALFPSEPEPFYGSMVPLPRDDDEHARTKDPRPSIGSLYRNRDEYLAKVKAAADALVEQRFMLAQDVERALLRAGAFWDWATRAR